MLDLRQSSELSQHNHTTQLDATDVSTIEMTPL
jgi:hypothetical protein